MNKKTKTQEKMTAVRVLSYVMTVCFAALFLYFLFHPSYYTNGKLSKGTLRPDWKVCAAEYLLLLSGLILIRRRRWLTEKLQGAARRLKIVAFFANPFVVFAFTYVITRKNPRDFTDNYYGGAYLWAICFWLNLLVILMLQVLLLVITNSIAAACLINLFVAVLFCIANYFIMEFRAIPILASDFTMLGTAAEVADNFDYTMTVFHVLALQAALVYALAFLCLGGGGLFSLKKRLLFSAGSLAVLAVLTNSLFLSDFLEDHKIEINMFKPLISYWRNGPYVTMIRSMQYMNVHAPEGYSSEEVAGLAAKYPSDQAADAKDRPNILVIVDEAFADLGVYRDLGATADYMPFLHSLEKSSTHGYVYASEYGKGTANSEFEVLTGNSTLLIPQTSIAFQLYIKQDMPSIVSCCADMGYQGLLAVHPFTRTNYNRAAVYPLLGFETYLSDVDFGENPDLLRNYISDEAVMDKLIEKYEEAKASSDAPVFLYTMTMQNHTGYAKRFDNCPIEITLPDYPEKSAEMYLNLVRHTDRAVEKLITYFEQSSDPTLILFLGDHQPNMTTEFFKMISDGTYKNWNAEEQMVKYAVPFYLWSNYGLPTETYEKTSMNYLQSILLEDAGLPMTGYQKYLLELMEQIPAVTARGYWGADGTFYELDDASSPYYSALLEYEQILYNTIFDPKKRPDGFFELQ